MNQLDDGPEIPRKVREETNKKECLCLRAELEMLGKENDALRADNKRLQNLIDDLYGMDRIE